MQEERFKIDDHVETCTLDREIKIDEEDQSFSLEELLENNNFELISGEEL